MKKKKGVDYKKAWSKLKRALKIELSTLEDDLYLLEDLKLKERRLGQYEESRAYYRTYAKTLTLMRKLTKEEKEDDKFG